ncbi:NAD(P)H-hydrate dehydratase [Leptobacterium flavescens]|uniref:Bifunctional NAD(P)H-hydrate repair enzyme n=1 Tax=Leptobacterium flavescens TaxID=472055 RepID=A0A6P0UF39_9FLAO|nr:NAD(P)H-hydrate dehydratase [Leptobacterium flavescens]NER11891.1 NAD(P)H-hydrate dehydratase [Leptobacterium flavescens]
MKIFTREQIYAADKFTIEKQNISSDELMERAGTAVFNWLHSRLQGAQVKIHVFCGVRNNGGDGLVIARHLITHGYNVEAYIANFSEDRSKDFLLNLDRIKDVKHWPKFINCVEDFPQIAKEDIVVDAIFGIGLNRPPEGCTAELITYINSSRAFTLAVDVPSGLYMDGVPENKETVIRANYVLSFQAPKLIFFLPETGVYANQWEALDIGLDPEYMFRAEAGAELIDKFEVLPMYIPRDKFSHKGTYGHSLMIGGSYGKIGAALLSSEACLKSGGGLVTSYIPECGYEIVQTALPEIMVITDEEEKFIGDISFDIEPTVIGIGPGIGTHEKTADALEKFLKENKTPLVVDADALNILSKNKELLKLLPGRTVLTPHPGELERLIGKWKDDFDKLKKAKAFSKKYKLILLIKGAHSIVVDADKLYINNTGNPGMATAGSGDVLTGIITGLISQGYEPLVATIFGTYLHGKAGDLAVIKTGYQALTATEIGDFIGDAYLDLFQQEPQAAQSQDQNENNS